MEFFLHRVSAVLHHGKIGSADPRNVGHGGDADDVACLPAVLDYGYM
jgi:hypothetical protein